MYKSRIARPEQLCVVHERGNGELSLQTRKGGKHAPRGQQGILGAKPEHSSKGAAHLTIKMAEQRRLAGQHRLAAMDGAHFGQETIRALQNCLRARVKRRN